MPKKRREPIVALGSEMLDEDFLITSSREHGIVGNIKEFSNRTHYMKVDPMNFEFFSMYKTRISDMDDFVFIRIKPYDVDMKLLMPQDLRHLHFSPEKGNLGALKAQCLLEMGLTKKQLKDIDAAGFFLQYRSAGKFITLIPSRAFLATLCRQLGIGKLNCGVDPIRDIYLASRMKDAEKFTLVYRSADGYGKAFGCFSTKFEQNSQMLIFDFKKYLSEFGDVTIRGWKLDHFITTVNFAFNDIGMRVYDKVKITPGVKLTMSDVGDSSYALQNAFYINGGVVLCNQSVSRRHSGVLSVEEMTNKYHEEMYPKLVSIIDELEMYESIPVKNKEETIKQIFSKIGFPSVYGNKNFTEFYQNYMRNMDGPGTLLDAVLFVLKVPGIIHRKHTAYMVDKISECIGKALEINLKKVLKL